MKEFPNTDHPDSHPDEDKKGNIRIERIAEQLTVSKERVITGQVHVHRSTIHKHVPVNLMLTSLNAEVDVVNVGRYVDMPPQSREEGNVTIIPIYEEHIEIVKKIFLKQEVRITKKQTEEPFNQQVELKEHIITVTRDNKE